MKGGKRPLGYTIVEVMVVLAVSGVMFVIASSFINGKQERSSFITGVNELASQIQDVISQVQSGEYSDINMSCYANSGLITINSSVNPSQGTNSGCVFLGKAIYFPEQTGQQIYYVMSIAGSRLDPSGNPATNPATADAKVISNPPLTIIQGMPDQLTFGLPGAGIYTLDIAGHASHAYTGIAFLQGQGAVNPVTGYLETGTQTVVPYVVTGLGPGQPQPNAESDITGSNLTAAQTISLCVTDGTRYATINITGYNQNSLSLNVTQADLGATACP